MPLNNTFSIIIVTWNALHHIKRFLPDVVKHTSAEAEIIIADNASEDGTAEWVKKQYPDCKIVRYDKNLGYAQGNNKAVKYATGNIIIFLNNDAKPKKGWLMAIDQAFEDPATGVVQPKIRSAENPEWFEYAGAAGGFIDWLGYPFCRGRIFDHIEKDTGQYEKPAPIFWASGAAFAIRKKLFLEAGGFDVDFQFHMEEIDLCWRCHKLGVAIRYEPRSTVYHLGGGSLPESSPRKTFFNYRNSLFMLTKNLDQSLFPKIFSRLILDGIAGARHLIKGEPGHTTAIIKSHFSYYASLRKILKKRALLLKNNSRITPAALVHQRLIVFDFFLRGKKTYTEINRDE